MNRANWVGIGLTVVFHALLLGLCFKSGLKYIYPPPQEQAVLMSFEEEPQPPEEVVVGQEPRAEDPDPQQEVELVKRAESPVKGTTANLSEESTVGDDGDVEVPEPKREINKRALFPSAANNKQDTLTQHTAAVPSPRMDEGHSQGNTLSGNTDGKPGKHLATLVALLHLRHAMTGYINLG